MMKSKKSKKEYSVEELYNPQFDLSRDAVAYGRQSSKDQMVKNVQSHISQTIMLLAYTKELGYRDDGRNLVYRSPARVKNDLRLDREWENRCGCR